MLILGGQLTITVEVITVEAIAVEMIAVEVIISCVDPGGVTFHVHFVHNHEISVPPRHSVR